MPPSMALGQFSALICVVVPAMAGAPAPAWPEGAAFGLPAAEVRAASEAIPVQAEHPVRILRVEEEVILDEEGRQQVRVHYFYRIDQEAAVPYWGNVSTGWTAWYEEKPALRARVIGPEGRENLLDPATAAVFRPTQKDPEVFTDRMELKAPLPMIAKGCIVEVEITNRELRPFSRSGVRSSFTFDNTYPVQSARFTLDAPRSVDVKLKCEGFSEKLVQRTHHDQRTRYTLAMGPLAAQKRREPFQALDQELSRTVKYTTTPSWQSVAREYAAIVQGQVRDADLKAAAATAVGTATGRKERIDALLAYVQKRVRYTGLEFGEASIVPHRPAEVLAHGYGDCKDKACLLMALLDAVGIQAQVALLRVGQEYDVDPDMPGLAFFDHVIVHLPGSEPLWIDPTDRMARAGELPVADQGRFALVIADGTRELLRTPQAEAAHNLGKETLEVFLAEDGPGRIVTTLGATGAEELRCRYGYGQAEPEKLKEFLKKQVVQRYQAEDLGVIDLREPSDLDRPFQLRYEALGARQAFTTTREASVLMGTWPLVETFYNLINASESDKPSGTDPSTNKPAERTQPTEPRRTDLVFREPEVVEASWLFHPPLGYANDSLPEDTTQRFGPATLTSAFSRREDGTVEARFRFECAQLRWSRDQVNEARQALKAFGAAKKQVIHFQNVGESHLSAGRIKEALDAFQETIQAQPGAAAPLLRMARAQVSGGLGESARLSAAAALALEPRSPLAHATLGWVLQHDLAGRRFKEGWQRKEAIAAYRAAIALEPKGRAARWNLAQVLEVDARGDRFASSDLPEAIRLYEDLAAEERSAALDGNLVRCLAHAGRFEEARVLAKTHLGVDPWNEWYVAMTACAKGLSETLADAAQNLQDLDTRRKAFLYAGDLLVGFRHYGEAAALMNEGAAMAEQQTQTRAWAEQLARTLPSTAPAWPPKDPQAAALHFLLRLLDRPGAERPLSQHFAKAQREVWNDDYALRIGRKLLNLPRYKGLPRAVVADLLQAQVQFSREGSDAAGYRINFELPGFKSVLMVTAEDGTYRIVCFSQDENSEGRQALYLLRHGDPKGAGAWLDRVLETANTGWGKDVLSPSPVVRLRTKGAAQSPQELKAAAACVLATSIPSDGALPILREAQVQSWTPEQLQALRKAFVQALLRSFDAKEADLVLGQLQVANPTSYSVMQLRIFFLMEAGRWDEALTYAGRILTLLPEDLAFQKCRWKCLMRLGRTREANLFLADLLAKGKAGAQDCHEFVLLQLELGLVDARTLELARKATLNPEDQSSATLQTLAAVMAELGRTSEARETLLAAIALTNRATPRSEDWYVFGRLAENLGDVREARACYVKVLPDTDYPLSDKNFFVGAARRRVATF